jgi:ribosome biogenesis GTPase
LFDDVIQIAQRCQFRNCSHEGESGCAIGPALTSGELDQRRFANFVTLSEEQARNAKSLAERHDRLDRQERKIASGRSQKSASARNRRRRRK